MYEMQSYDHKIMFLLPAFEAQNSQIKKFLFF